MSTPTSCPSTEAAPNAAASPSTSARVDVVAPPASKSTSTSPTYTFSAEATPFIPSFMRTSEAVASVPPAASAPPPPPDADVDGVDEEEETGDENAEYNDEDRTRFSQMWMQCLQQMQGHEVGMLMDMMPLDIQDLYFDKLSDEYLHHDHEQTDKTVHALCAAHKMVRELSPEQLVHIEEFLVETDALNPQAARPPQRLHVQPHLYDEGEECEEEEDFFMHHDAGMGPEEEEWLLEQMMAAAGHADATARHAAPQKGKK